MKTVYLLSICDYEGLTPIAVYANKKTTLKDLLKYKKQDCERKLTDQRILGKNNLDQDFYKNCLDNYKVIEMQYIQ